MTQTAQPTPPRRAPASAAATATLLLALLAGCAQMAPLDAEPPPMSAAWKQPPPDGWRDAAPADALPRGQWWRLYGVAQLDALASRVAVGNQSIAAALAAQRQAEALLREQQAALFPTLRATGGAARSGGGASSASGNRFSATLVAGWEADVWGRLGDAARAAGASAQASAADLAAARLAAQATLASTYFLLREADAEIALLRDTIEAYRRSAEITSNRYQAGIAPKSDLLQAQTQLANAQADLAALEGSRAQQEHAIAVLLGQPPAAFELTPSPWPEIASPPPALPPGLPSELLQRRPDIAAAQRRVAAANAQVGVARAAFYPSFTLSGQYGLGASRLGDLFSASAAAWSLGISLAQSIFDAGANQARLDQQRAAWEGSVAQYRGTVLAAFQEVEDALALLRAQQQQLAQRRIASSAADQAEQQVMNRYRAGQVGYAEVVAAQVSALSARRAVVQLAAAQRVATVSLQRALGGGWDAALLDAQAATQPR